MLRNLVAIVFTYEPLMLLMLPEGRVSSSWCPPLSHSTFYWNNPDLIRAEGLERIFGYTKTFSMLGDFSERDKIRLACNIEGLRTPCLDGKRTIEFRHHHSSLDPDANLNWIYVCIKFVEKACLAKGDELWTRLRGDVSKPIELYEGELNAIDFLMWLHYPAQAYY